MEALEQWIQHTSRSTEKRPPEKLFNLKFRRCFRQQGGACPNHGHMSAAGGHMIKPTQSWTISVATLAKSQDWG
jgi:hypothetical protein